jgi:hypothetical protein
LREITVQELLGQLREMVDLLAAPAPIQERWLMQERLPVGELALQLDDAVPGWFARLATEGLLTLEAEQALLALNQHFDGFSGPTYAEQ